VNTKFSAMDNRIGSLESKVGDMDNRLMNSTEIFSNRALRSPAQSRVKKVVPVIAQVVVSPAPEEAAARESPVVVAPRVAPAPAPAPAPAKPLVNAFESMRYNAGAAPGSHMVSIKDTKARSVVLLSFQGQVIPTEHDK
jgi:hypothetical protein